MNGLPSGVTLRDFFSPQELRGEILRRVRENYLKRFPMENDKVRLELTHADYDPKKKTVSLEDYEKALLTGGRLSVPLRGNMRLTDKVTGQVLEEKEGVLANVPYLTDDGTFVMGGSHYITNNQSRLKPGIYARRKDNGELESHINTRAGTGPQMRLFMEPETGVYRIQADKANIKLYPILKELGYDDNRLAQAWGPEILAANQKAWDKQAFGKFYDRLLRQRAKPDASDDEKREAIMKELTRASFDPEVNTRTLGKPHTNLSLDTIVDASNKLLRIRRHEINEDDRDHPANRTFHSVDDFLADRVSQDAGKLGRQLLYRSTYDRSLKSLRPGYFTDQLDGLIVSNQLSQPVPGLNPMELYDQQKRVIPLGEGGISSMESVPMSSRNLHPGQLGLIDPIRSSESKAIGVDQRFSIAAKKGSDNHVYFPLRNRKTGEVEYMNPVQLQGKVVAFANAPSLEPYKTALSQIPLRPAAVQPVSEVKTAGYTVSHTKDLEDGRVLDVTKLWELARSLPTEEVPLGQVYGASRSPRSGFSSRRLEGADLSYPVLLNEENDLLDGRHRFFRHQEEGARTMAAVKLPRALIEKAVLPGRNAASLLSLPKTAANTMGLLRLAKEESDRKNYGEKTRILRQLIDDAPNEWEIDSTGEGVYGITHRPTGWRYHLPTSAVPQSLVAPAPVKRAADLLFLPKTAEAKADLNMTPAAAAAITPTATPKRPNDPAYMAGFRQSMGRSTHTRPVPGMRDGKLSYIMPDEADYEMVSPNHMFTETSNLVPISSTIKGARLFISSKYFTQALPLQNAESPLVDTLDEDTGHSYSRTMGGKLGVKRAEQDGEVTSVTEKYVELKGQDGKRSRIDLKRFFPHNRKTYTTEVPTVKPGDQVKAGQMLARSNYTDNEGRLALGKNLRVAFMPAPDGATFEDSITISESAAKKLTSSHLYGFDVQHKHGVESNKSKFISLFPNRYTNEQLAKIGSDGMVKPGAHLDPGDPVVLSFAPRTLSSKDQSLGNLHKVLRNSFQDLSQTWEKSTAGTVAHAVAHRGGLQVNVATQMPLQQGDKISARQGAKGVIGKIIPDDNMVRNGAGDPVDIIINPAALIGRVNPGMVFEALLGKISEKTGKKYRLPTFSQESMRDYVEHELKAHNLSDTEELEDPMTGRKVPGVMTGRQFFMKLEHTSESKVSGRGNGGADLNDQPTRGGDEGAKRLGGLQALALLSHGATEVLRDAHLWRGSGNPEMWRRLKLGESMPTPKQPFIYDKFLNSLRAGGIKVHKDGSKLKLLAMTDRDVDRMAQHEVQNSETLDPKSGAPVPGGLMDYGLHGGPEGKGWSYIKLDHPMPSPLMEEPIRRLLGLTEKKMREVLSGQESLGGKTGAMAIQEALKGLDLDHMEAVAKETIRGGRKTKRDDAVRQLNFISGLRRSGTQPADMMITKVPVLPPTYRPISKVGKMMLTSDANYLYKDLMTARNAYRANQADLPESELGQERLAVYDALKAVQGMGDPINAETAAKGVKGFIRQVAGVGGPKSGMFMSKVIGHPVNAVGRSVIIPDADLNMDQVGLPEEMAWPMFGPFTMRSMVREGMPATQAAKEIEKRTPLARKYLEKSLRPVMYSRDPALHRFAIMGADPVIVSGNSIRLSPLVVKPFGADFDGDQMNMHVPVSDSAVAEVREKMFPSKNLFGLKGMNVHYTPSQEFILGLFNAAQGRKGLKPVKFPNAAAALEAYQKKLIPIDQPIEIAA